MGRLHLFEFEDQKWFPSFLRNYMTDFLQFLSNKTKMYAPVTPVIENGMKRSNTNRIIDLGSGGGGGLLWLNSELLKRQPQLRIVLTDLYPNIPAYKYTCEQAENIEFNPQPVNAMAVPDSLTGMRTMFLSLHHFKPRDARRILQNAVDARQGIAIFEAQERSIPSLLAMIFSPVTVLLTTPFIRPFKITRIVFTYLIPLVPLFVFWDGIVSSLRTYSVKEMQALVNSLNGADQYTWEIDRIKSGPGIILYLLGTKSESSKGE